MAMNIPDPEDGLKAVAPIIPALYGALEAGTQAAREFFESRDAEIEPYHASSTARWEAKRFLENQGHAVVDVDYGVADIAMNGLRVTFNKHVIWILKSSDGLLPVAASGPKKHFYAQQLSLAFPDSGPVAGTIALVVLWDVTSDYQLTELVLACPESGDATLASVKAYWYIGIPHPASVVETQPHETAHEDDDLPNIKLESDEETGTNPTP